MANENLIECRSCGIMNPRTVAHCPECGAPSLEEENSPGEKATAAGEEATPGNAGGSDRVQGMSGISSTATTKCPQCGAQKPTLSRQRYQVSELTKSVAIVVVVLAAIVVMGYLRDMI